MWASTNDSLPFYLNAGSIHEAISTRHKYPGGRYTLHQSYRDLIGESFLCIIVADSLTRDYSYQLAHYLYKFFTNQPHPSNQEAVFCRKEPVLEPYLYKYEVIKHCPALPPSPPESMAWRANYKDQFKAKLLKQRENLAYQKSIEHTKPAFERAVPLTVEELIERKKTGQETRAFGKKED